MKEGRERRLGRMHGIWGIEIGKKLQTGDGKGAF